MRFPLPQFRQTPFGEYLLVTGVVAAMTIAGWFVPTSHHPLGFLYLLAVVCLSLKVGRWPVLFAAALSALAWDFIFLPPRFEFAALSFADSVMFGIYFLVALVTGQITARLRNQERAERLQQLQTTALFRLNKALAAALTIEEIADIASRQAVEAFGDTATLQLGTEAGASRPAEAAPPYRTGRLCASIPAGGWLCVPAEKLSRSECAERQRFADRFAGEIGAAVERYRLRKIQEREKRLVDSERLHRTLLDSVSHELKTPLAILRGAVDKLHTDQADKRAQLTQEIRTATRRLDHLVGNLLDQTRLESGMLKPRLDWCDPRDLIQAARRQTAESLSLHPISMELAEDLPLVMADAALMEHALSNLLLNAAVHTPPGTPVTITAGVTAARDSVFIRVSDLGGGLSPDLQHTLFEKFHRGRAASPGGAGLGLSIVRGFMQAQGGEVEACNNEQGGAAFTLRLPFRTPPEIPLE